MQKRPSATELNPDNWRQEEQPEEAGQFRRATDDQMKARVVKKACRMSCGKARSKQCETVQVKCPDNKPSLPWPGEGAREGRSERSRMLVMNCEV